MSVAEKIVRADVTALKKSAKVLNDRAGYLIEITNEDEYEKALALMDVIIEDYDNQQILFELLSNSIERWEESSLEFTDFNKRIGEGDPAVSVLRVLMDHHGLGVADLPEIGSKSLVSKILNGRDRQLTRNHIDSLSQRFNISPALFFNS